MNKLYWLNFWFRICPTAFLACCLGITTFVSAEIPQPVDPLLLNPSYPLIPKGYGRRKLSSFEKYRIQKEIDNLNQTAQDELDRGDTNSAITQWYRQLRLARVINTETEIKALGKVGAIFWEENLREDVRNIANRLMEIQTMDREISGEVLNDLAMAYESVRYLDKAIEIHQQILATNKTKQNNTLDKLGELYLSIFDYDNAAIIYQDKLKQNISKDEQESILKTLVEIFDNSNKQKQSIAAKEQLIELYLSENKNKKISALTMAIAHDYEALSQTKKAFEAYKKSFDLALDNKQLRIASDVLISIGKLHEKQENLEKAVDIYEQLIDIQQQSYNDLGLINTYDTLGKIYLNLGRQKLAKQSFEKGLYLAGIINYRVKYFRDRLDKL